MAKRQVDLLDALAISFDETAEDQVLDELKLLDKKYIRIMKGLICIVSILVGVSMYEYLRKKIDVFTDGNGIITDVAIITHILLFTIFLLRVLDWKYRFRLSIINAYNRVLVILSIIAITNFMTVKIVPGINYLIMMITYGLGYKFIVWIFANNLSIVVKISLTIVILALLSVIYCKIMLFLCCLFKGCYKTDRLTELIYAKIEKDNNLSYNSATTKSKKKNREPSFRETVSDALEIYEEAKMRENLQNISDKLDSINYNLWNK